MYTYCAYTYKCWFEPAVGFINLLFTDICEPFPRGKVAGTRNRRLVLRLEMLEPILPLPHLRGVVSNLRLIEYRNKFAAYTRTYVCVHGRVEVGMFICDTKNYLLSTLP
jgi:hypothetical protein